jgi:hypothetical protein
MARVPAGRAKDRPTVPLEEGATPGGALCPACGKPLFVWVETQGWGPREDQIIDRCENCGLAVPRDHVPDAAEAAAELYGTAGNGRPHDGRTTFRAPNAASLPAWLGAENWAALRPGDRKLKPSPMAVRLLLERRGLQVTSIRHLARPGMALMWQTLLNLLTFHRDFASEAVSGRLRPGTGRGRTAFAIDFLVTILAGIPTAMLAVVLEGGAVITRRGGVIEVRAAPEPA